MSPRRIIGSTLLAGAIAATGVAGAAQAPVSPQQSLYGNAPVTVPGTGVQQGEWMGSKQHLVFRDAALGAGRQVRVTLTAPKGQTIRGIVPADGSEVAFTPIGDDYAGKRRVVVRAKAVFPGADGVAEGRIYALTR